MPPPSGNGKIGARRETRLFYCCTVLNAGADCFILS